MQTLSFSLRSAVIKQSRLSRIFSQNPSSFSPIKGEFSYILIIIKCPYGLYKSMKSPQNGGLDVKTKTTAGEYHIQVS